MLKGYSMLLLMFNYQLKIENCSGFINYNKTSQSPGNKNPNLSKGIIIIKKNWRSRKGVVLNN